jgi:Spy/CpxP family protein refolding chaperone
MKNRTSALAVITAVLLIGCLLGIAGFHFYERSLQKRSVASFTSGVQGHTGRLADRLQLNNAQKAQLDEILENSRIEIDAGRMELESKMQVIRTKANEKIAAILNDEQKKKFQQILNEAESRQQHEGRGHGHGGYER